MKTSTVQALLYYIYQSKKKRLSCIIMSGSSRSQLDIYDVCSAHKTGKRLLHAHCETFLCFLINLDQTGSYWIKMNYVGSRWIKIYQNVSKCISAHHTQRFSEKFRPRSRDIAHLFRWNALISKM